MQIALNPIASDVKAAAMAQQRPLAGAGDRSNPEPPSPLEALLAPPVSSGTGRLPAGKVSPSGMNVLLAAQEGDANSVLNLSPEQQEVVQELRQTDQEVRAHEQAHKTVGGPYAGSVSFETVTGPDGRQYAVAGEVDIDASPVPGRPEATVRKMEIVVRAALAPPEPSPQDIAVARAAQEIKIQAQRELAAQQQEDNAEKRGDRKRAGSAPAAESAADVIAALFAGT